MISPELQKKSKPTPAEFVRSVLDLNPKLAVFDCDGTLWAGDSGMDFMYWTLDRHFVPCEIGKWARNRYAEYQAGKVSEEAICGEMVQIYSGVPEEKLIAGAREFFDEVVRPRIFPEMLELTERLISEGCELWAVSSTNHWVVAAGVKPFGIPESRVLGVCVEIEQGQATHKLICIPTGKGKATRINEKIGRIPDAVFGNSMHDAAMLTLARHPFAINPNPDLSELAREHGWPIYQPALA